MSKRGTITEEATILYDDSNNSLSEPSIDDLSHIDKKTKRNEPSVVNLFLFKILLLFYYNYLF